MEALLQKIQQRIQTNDRSPQLECWLQDVGLAEDREGELALICPNVFSKRWLEERYRGSLERVISEETGRPVALTFRVNNLGAAVESEERPCKERPEEARDQGLIPAGTLSPSPATGMQTTEESTESAATSQWLSNQFSFTSFVVGAPNRFAWSAAQEVCRGTRSEYNPLLVLASTGLGKTHLVNAIALSVARQDPSLKVVYCTAEGFLNEMIHHLKTRSIPEFKNKYRKHCDTFVLDDLQFILGKDALQSELCHTLDAMLQHQKRVVLAGNLLPRGTKGLSDSLRSRLFSGLVVSLERPDYEMRLTILNRLACNAGLSFPEGTLETLARLVRSEVRDLEGAFKRLLALHRLSPDPVGPETIEERLFDLAGGEGKVVSLDAIRKHVARYFHLAPEDLSSRTRQHKVVYPRQIGMYLSRKYTHESLEAIGSLYHRDHSSVLYALRSLERKAAEYPRVRRELEFVEDRLLEKI